MTAYTFRLRQGVRFHGGTDLAADIVKRNIDRNMALSTRASGAMVDSIKAFGSVEVTGSHEFKLLLKKPSGQIPYIMGDIAGMVAIEASVIGDRFGASSKPSGLAHIG